MFFRISVLLFFTILSFTSFASSKYALVIGNDSYTAVPPLNKAVNDAKAIAATLKDAGFEITLLQDATYRDIVKSIDTFARKLKQDDVAVFFCGSWCSIRFW